MGKINVLIGIYEGVVDEIRTTSTEKKAQEIERKLCEKLEVPFDHDEREEYYEKAFDDFNEVYSYEVELEQ